MHDYPKTLEKTDSMLTRCILFFFSKRGCVFFSTSSKYVAYACFLQQKVVLLQGRHLLVRYTWRYNPYNTWPYKWVAGVRPKKWSYFTLLINGQTPSHGSLMLQQEKSCIYIYIYIYHDQNRINRFFSSIYCLLKGLGI